MIGPVPAGHQTRPLPSGVLNQSGYMILEYGPNIRQSATLAPPLLTFRFRWCADDFRHILFYRLLSFTFNLITYH